MLASILLAVGTLSLADATPFRRLKPRQQVQDALVCVPTTVTRTVPSFIPVITNIPECVGNACGINTITQQGQPFVTSTLTAVNGQPGDVIGGTTFINPANTVQNAAFNSFTICDNQCTVAGNSFPVGQTVFFTSNQPVQPGTTTLGGATVTNANVPVTVATPQTNVFISTIINGQTITDPAQVVTIETVIPGGVTTITRTVTDIITPPTQVPPGVTSQVTVTSTPPPNGGTTITETRTSNGPQTTETVTIGVTSTLSSSTSSFSIITSGQIDPPPPGTRSSTVTVSSSVVSSSSIAVISTSVPVVTSTVPIVTSSVPDVSSSVPVVTSSVPVITSSGPVVTTSSSAILTSTVTPVSSSTVSSAAPSSSVAALGCGLNTDCAGRGLPVAICLNATGLPVLGNIPISGGTCALSALLPGTNIPGVDLSCNTNAQCTGIGLQTCVVAGVPIVDNAIVNGGLCLLGVVTNPTGTGPSNPQTTLAGLLAVGTQCTSNGQCLLGLCVPALGGLSVCADPALAPLLSSGSGTPAIINSLPVLPTVLSQVVGVVQSLLDPLVPTGSPALPIVSPIVSGVLGALPLTGLLPQQTGAPTLGVPPILDGVASVVAGIGGSPSSAGPLAPVATVIENVGSLLNGGAGGGALPTGGVPNLLDTVASVVAGVGGSPSSAGPLAPVATVVENVNDLLNGGGVGGGAGSGALPTGNPIAGAISGVVTGVVAPILGIPASAAPAAPTTLATIPSAIAPVAPLPTLAVPTQIPEAGTGGVIPLVNSVVEPILSQVLNPGAQSTGSPASGGILDSVGGLLGGLGR